MTTMDKVGNNLEHIALETLIPYARNSRTHSDAQVAQIAASIREFGFTNPILIDAEGGIIAGHGRTMAARKLGLDEVPCIRLTNLTGAQKKAYIIADNKLALNAGWDDELLKIELSDLTELHLELTGFTQIEINSLLNLYVANNETPETSSTEINPDDYKLGHQCPKCGFEFDEK